MTMDEKVLWELFRETGDPTVWLLYRAALSQGDGDASPVSPE